MSPTTTEIPTASECPAGYVPVVGLSEMMFSNGMWSSTPGVIKEKTTAAKFSIFVPAATYEEKVGRFQVAAEIKQPGRKAGSKTPKSPKEPRQPKPAKKRNIPHLPPASKPPPKPVLPPLVIRTDWGWTPLEDDGTYSVSLEKDFHFPDQKTGTRGRMTQGDHDLVRMQREDGEIWFFMKEGLPEQMIGLNEAAMCMNLRPFSDPQGDATITLKRDGVNISDSFYNETRAKLEAAKHAAKRAAVGQASAS